MSDNQVSKRIAKRIASYVGEAGRLINHFSLEDIIKEELATMESQLQQSDATATAMGLALTDARIENERLREALAPFAKIVVGSCPEIVPNGYSNPEAWRVDVKRARKALKEEGA